MSHSLPVTGNTVKTAPENRVFYPALDGLRAIAFLLVFGEHYIGLPWGWTGVNVFLVLSGFLITGILFDTRDDPHRVRNFYVRRTLRIFPLYYGLFFGILLLQPLMHWRWSAAWFAWPLYLGNFLGYLSPSIMNAGSPLALAASGLLLSERHGSTSLFLGHLWSLCVEEQFYLVWPCIVFLTRSRRALLWICGVAVVLLPLLRVVAQHTAPAWMLNKALLYIATPFQVDALLLGGMVALLWRGAERERIILIGRAVAVVAAIAAMIYLPLSLHVWQPRWHAHFQYPTWDWTWGLSFANLFAASLIVCVLRPVGFLYRCMRWYPLRWLGRISYGAYVFHYLFMGFYFRLMRHCPILSNYRTEETAMLGLACTVLLAWFSFRFFESRFLNLKERWTVQDAT